MKELLQSMNMIKERSKVRELVKGASNGFFHYMKSNGASYIGSDSRFGSRFMCFEYGGNVLEVDMKVVDKFGSIE